MLEPAATVVRLLGGPTKVSQIVGVHRTRVSNWMRPREAGGTGGVIPLAHHRRLLQAAVAEGASLTAEELLPSETPQ